MGSHYIPVNSLKLDGVSIQPEVYCPANGFPDPTAVDFPEVLQNYPDALGQACIIGGYVPDPFAYVPDDVVNDVIPPSSEKIVLIATDQGDRNIYLKCTISNSGKYKVDVYGAGDVLLFSSTITNNSYFNDFMPIGQGKPAAGFTYFRIEIYPEIGTNSITNFRLLPQSNYDTDGPNVLSCYLYTPNVTTLASMLSGIKKIKYCEFLTDCDLLTSLNSAFYTCIGIKKIILPGSCAALTDMGQMCTTTSSLQEIKMPTYLPVTTTLQSAFNASTVGEVILPDSMPELINLSSTFYNSFVKKVVLPSNAPKLLALDSVVRNCLYLITCNVPTNCNLVTSLNYSFSGCPKLIGDFVFPEMQNLTNLSYAFSDSPMVNRIEFTGAANLCTTISYMANRCYSVKYIKFPSSMNGLVSMSNTNYVIYNCYLLEELILPDSWYPSSDYLTPGTSFLQNLTGCFKLTTISKVTTARNALIGNINFINVPALVEFDEPNLAFSSVTISPVGAAMTNTIRGALSKFDCKWSFITSLVLKFNNICSTEMLRIIENLPTNSGVNALQLALSGNPCANDFVVTQGNKSSESVFYAGYELPILPNVGDEFQMGANTYLIAATFTTGTNLITLTVNHLYSNGRKIVITHTVAAIGISYNVEYFVINASGKTFQISLTEGGEAVSFSGSTTGYITTKVLVTNVNNRYITLDVALQSNSFTSAYFSTHSLYELSKKGWYLYLQ